MALLLLLPILLPLSLASTGWKQQPHLIAEAGSNISLACPGYRLLRHNDQTVLWDKSSTRSLDTIDYTLHFNPVTRRDNGIYHCLVNDRGHADIPILLTVQDVPDPPPSRPMVSRITSRTVLLTWATPLQDNNAPIRNYKIYVREGDENWTKSLNTQTNLTEYLVMDLKPFTTYTFRVSAENQIGQSPPSKDSFQTMTHREKPTERPRFIRGRIMSLSRGFELHWEPPSRESLNGEFMGYIMTYTAMDSGVSNTLNINDESLRVQNYSLSGLSQHTTYNITLAARNLEGVGPADSVVLRTEDGVPLKPRGLESVMITSNAIQIRWRRPENFELLGNELLGYRIYIRDALCAETGQLSCESMEPKTIQGKDSTQSLINNLRPATEYEFRVRGFTSKREGGDSDPLKLTTDTAPPSQPIISVLNCTGKGDILLEWRRPRVYYGKVNYYIVYFRSDQGEEFKTRKIDIISNNSSDIYIVYLTNLKNHTTYNVAVSAVTNSTVVEEIKYFMKTNLVKNHLSINDIEGLSPLMLAVALLIVLLIMLAGLTAYYCRRRLFGYGFVPVPSCTFHTSARTSRGYTGEPESDIPGSLFPKHVQGLHASGGMAFLKDFEFLERTADHSKYSQDNKHGSGDKKLTFLDSWLAPGQFVVVPGDASLLSTYIWKAIWDNQISLVVCVQSNSSRDDLGQISESKFFGEFQVQVENETMAPDYVARNMKVRKGRTTRNLVQLMYSGWPDHETSLLPHPFLSFVKSASTSAVSLATRVLVCSRPTNEGGIFYMSLHSMIRQLEDTGDVNVGAYSRYLAERGIILDSAHSYIKLHDSLSNIIDVDFNRKSYAV